LQVPPLRERVEDIPVLAAQALTRLAGEMGRGTVALAEDACAALQEYSWPGNVRELEHAVEQAVVLTLPQAQLITANDLPEELRSSVEGAAPVLDQMTNLPAAVEALEIRMIKKVLIETNGNKSQAAEKLGLSRRGFLNKLERYRIGV
jgi:two-component system response regulator HydG